MTMEIKANLKALGAAAALLIAAGLGLAGEATFTAKPTAVKNGDKVKIAFAVSAPTDVAVYIENAKGAVVRHLVAGVLGDKAPAPLRPGLAQEVEWDGRADYGKPAEGGPFKVRVALGLGAKYDKAVSWDPERVAGGIYSLGVSADGVLYVDGMAFDRDGKYIRSNSPHSSALTPELARYFDVMDDGSPDLSKCKIGKYLSAGPVFQGYSGAGPGGTLFVVSPDGRELYGLTGPGITRAPLWGPCPADKFVVEHGIKEAQGLDATGSFLILSSDASQFFMTGLSGGGKGGQNLPAVFRADFPARTGGRAFFGDPAKAGKDDSHLGAPRGLAVDGEGRLFVADLSNDRVVVLDEKTGKYQGEIPVPQPKCLGVSQKTKCLYVASGEKAASLMRFNLPAGGGKWADLKPSAQIALGEMRGKSYVMAVDSASSPAIVYVGYHTTKAFLRRIEDSGAGTFGKVSTFGTGEPFGIDYSDLVVDRLRKEVYIRITGNGLTYQRYSEGADKSEIIRLGSAVCATGDGVQLTPAPNDNLYGIQWGNKFWQWDRQGKAVPWEKPIRPKTGEPLNRSKWEEMGAARSFVVCGMVCQPHTLGVRWSDGHLFILEPYNFQQDLGAGGRTPKSLHEFLPTGERITPRDGPIIWKVSANAVGPRFDAAGNIYIAEVIRPKGWSHPSEIDERLAKAGKKPSKDVPQFYGSIVKFGPKGGMIHYPDSSFTKGTPYDGEPKLDPGLKSMDVDFRDLFGGMRPAKVTGAEWVHPGLGHVGICGCNCENMSFDVDEFGRAFFPDQLLFQVRVADTGGNAITHFGGFGSADNRGPESPVFDEKTGRPRAAKPGEKSPLAQPDIAFAWLLGVGVTDRYAYMSDSINRRVLRAKLTYAAEETCEIK
jgi:hypothetical protein